MQNREYYDSAMCDFVDVSDLEKPLMIVSSGKSTLAYEITVMMAERAGLQCELGMLRCEDGEMHEHAFIACRRPLDRKGRNRAREALDLVFQHKETDDFTRANFQYQLGMMLEYPLNEILDFIAGDLQRACCCDCCGGIYGLDKEYNV